MSRLSTLAALGGLLISGLAWAAPSVGPAEFAPSQNVQARDLEQIRRSGELRVLVNQSRNSSGEVKGQAIGVEAVRLRAFIQHLNQQAGSNQKKKISLRLIPKPKDQLLGALQRGEGDMVAPGELLDASRMPQIIPSRPIVAQVPMVLVTGSQRAFSLDRLSGQSLALSPGSAAGAALTRLNRQLVTQRKAPVRVEWVDPSLAVEDVLEMVQAGIYPATVVEKTIAERWLKVMPKLRLGAEVRLDNLQDMHWFFRNDSGRLQASADQFLNNYRAPANQDAAFNRVYSRLYRVHQPLDSVGRQRLERVRPTLQRYADKHQMDWLGLAALAFKESTLNPSARGASGAVGLMQITPGAARSVGVSSIHQLDNNVQASARYLADIRRKFFSSPKLNERERLAFTLAAYNMGPQRVQKLRDEAKRRGLNPNQWFFQVERIAMETVGMGVVSYVNSVNKYFLAYARERRVLE